MTNQATEALLHQAIQAHQRGAIDSAQQFYQQVLNIQPEHALARRNLGLIALQTGFYEEAAALLQSAIHLQSDIGNWHGELGQALRRCHRLQAAEQSFRQALAMPPVTAHAHYLLGDLLLDMHRMDEAISCFQQSLALDPRMTQVYAALAFLVSTGDYVFSQSEQQQLEDLLLDQSLADQQISALHFAKANLLHHQHDYDQAFMHFCTANEAKRRTHAPWERFDLQQQQSTLQQHQQMFTPNFFTTHQQRGSDSRQPVFIVGLLRTGTTMLERVLAAHPLMSARGELTDMRRIAQSRLPKRLNSHYPQCLLSTDDRILGSEAEWYLNRIRQHDVSTEIRIINKMPADFQLLGLMHMLFPNAAVIHTMREPIACLWSCFSRDVHARFSNDFSDLVGMYRIYRQYMALWNKCLPQRVFSVRYEQLVTDFQPVVSATLAHMKLQWDARILQFHQASDAVNTPSRMQVRKPVHRDAIASWKPYVRHLQPLLDGIAEVDAELGVYAADTG